jgi:hypothetical protein
MDYVDMGYSKELYKNLKSVHKLKSKEIRIYKRNEHTPLNQITRETSLFTGSVWGVPDTSVPFDNIRKDEDYKSTLRPTLVLETPPSFFDYSIVNSAPGTSKFHKTGEEFPTVLKAEVPPENLEKTTYFLFDYSWFAVQKTFSKKFTDLTNENILKLERMVEEL